MYNIHLNDKGLRVYGKVFSQSENLKDIYNQQAFLTHQSQYKDCLAQISRSENQLKSFRQDIITDVYKENTISASKIVNEKYLTIDCYENKKNVEYFCEQSMGVVDRITFKDTSSLVKKIH